MKQSIRSFSGRLMLWLMALSVLIGSCVGPVYAEPETDSGEETVVDPLRPADLEYENGNIILHKQAERVGPDEWEVEVIVTVGDTKVKKRQMEVVMLMDLSSSMRTNTAHNHTDECAEFRTVYTCKLDEHTHSETCCPIEAHTHSGACCPIEAHTHSGDCCPIDAHTHSDACCSIEVHTHSSACCPIEAHTHSGACCSITAHTHTYNGTGNDCYSNSRCNSHNSTAQHQAAGCYYNNNRWYRLTCTRTEHTHGNNCNYTCNKAEHTHSASCKPACNKAEHTHSASCVPACGKEVHTHSASCEPACNKEEHIHDASCVPACGKEVHVHDASCADLYTCTEHTHEEGKCFTYACDIENHEHTLGCYECPYYGFKDAVNATNDDEYMHNGNATRMAVATVAAERLLASLPASSTIITRLAFNSRENGLISGISSYYDVNTDSGTYLWQAINRVLSGNYFSSDPNTKKVFVILNDGGASDSQTTAIRDQLNAFKDSNGTDGTIFTVGFAQADSMLSAIAGGDGGKYLMANNADQLLAAFDEISEIMTAMLEDPMGEDVVLVGKPDWSETHSGVVSTSGQSVIYWHPANDKEDTINNTTIKYTYTVKLNDQADRMEGTHENVPLNKDTYFKYGTKGQDNVESMKSVPFPIPHATYSYSSIQTKWQANGENILPPTDVEKIISDQVDTYIPAYTQDYTYAPPIIPIEGSTNYYRYIDTTVTAGTTVLPNGLDDVNAANPVAHAVVHRYELVESHELYVDARKTLEGRDFDEEGDSFTFTLKAESEGAPMPEGAVNGEKTITITATSGSTIAFTFGKIEFTEATAPDAPHVYTIYEHEGNLDKVIYDTVPRTLKVTVTEVPGNAGSTVLQSTYTVDDIPNGQVHIINRLEIGSLKLEKAAVNSYLDQHQETSFNFVVFVRNVSGRAINGEYPIVKSDGTTSTVTFQNGYASEGLSLKAGEHVIIKGLPDGAVYTVTEGAAGGFTATATGDTGTITANQQSTASFVNDYAVSADYQFYAFKRLEGATLQDNQFSFTVKDENGKLITEGRNIDTGSVYFNTQTFTHEDIGEKIYYIEETIGNLEGVIYDRTSHTVKLTITDDGNGRLAIEDDLDEGEYVTFNNKYVTNLLTVSKTVDGNMGNRYKEFGFKLTVPAAQAGNVLNVSTDGGVTFKERTPNEQGELEFTLMHGDSICFYPINGTYTVTETDSDGYTTSYSLNGAESVTAASVTGEIPENGSHSVCFENTLRGDVPTGVSTPVSAALAGIIAAMAMLVIVCAGRRRRSLDK